MFLFNVTAMLKASLLGLFSSLVAVGAEAPSDPVPPDTAGLIASEVARLHSAAQGEDQLELTVTPGDEMLHWEQEVLVPGNASETFVSDYDCGGHQRALNAAWYGSACSADGRLCYNCFDANGQCICVWTYDGVYAGTTNCG